MLRSCSVCLEEKPLTLFRRRQKQCRVCENKKNLLRYHTKYKTSINHRKASYKYTLKTVYGLTEKDYRKMYQDQSGSCSICLEKISNIFEEDLVKSQAIDHCHTTGKIRGLLCRQCNTALGMLKDNVDSARRLVKYLEMHT